MKQSRYESMVKSLTVCDKVVENVKKALCDAKAFALTMVPESIRNKVLEDLCDVLPARVGFVMSKIRSYAKMDDKDQHDSVWEGLAKEFAEIKNYATFCAFEALLLCYPNIVGGEQQLSKANQLRLEAEILERSELMRKALIAKSDEKTGNEMAKLLHDKLVAEVTKSFKAKVGQTSSTPQADKQTLKVEDVNVADYAGNDAPAPETK